MNIDIKHRGKWYYGLFFMLMLTACGPQVPTQYDEVDALPKIYPDYVDVTIPVNIAPPTFVLDEEADEMIARYSVGSGLPAAAIDIICKDKMQPAIDDWRALVQAALAGGQAPAGIYRLTSTPATATAGLISGRSISMCRPTVSTRG